MLIDILFLCIIDAGSDLEAGGFPNIEFDPDSSVEGCVYVITPAQLKTLDMFMGSPQVKEKKCIFLRSIHSPLHQCYSELQSSNYRPCTNF